VAAVPWNSQPSKTCQRVLEELTNAKALKSRRRILMNPSSFLIIANQDKILQESGKISLHLDDKCRHLADILIILDCLIYKNFVGG
jgi:hypothetical protein